jgi:hypothetical protein
MWTFTGTASAAYVLCPNPSPPPEGGDNVYGVDTGGTAAVCLDYGYGNIGQGGGNDEFLNGGGALGYDGDAAGYVQSSLSPSGDSNVSSGSYSFAGVAGTDYALGIKDGSEPFWAVFALPSGDYDGLWEILNQGADSLSHFILYEKPGTTGPGSGGGSGQPVVPEPASLLLLGSGLGAAALKARKRKKQQAQA